MQGVISKITINKNKDVLFCKDESAEIVSLENSNKYLLKINIYRHDKEKSETKLIDSFTCEIESGTKDNILLKIGASDSLKEKIFNTKEYQEAYKEHKKSNS